MALAITTDDRSVERMLMAYDTALNPVAIAGLLRGVVEPFLHERIEARFSSEGDDVTGPWAPLRPATVVIRQSQGFPGDHPINVRTGDMLSYLTTTPGDILHHPGLTELELPGGAASGEMYDKIHTAQVGAPRTVARPVLGLGAPDLAFVLKALASHIEATGRKFGFK